MISSNLFSIFSTAAQLQHYRHIAEHWIDENGHDARLTKEQLKAFRKWLDLFAMTADELGFEDAAEAIEKTKSRFKNGAKNRHVVERLSIISEMFDKATKLRPVFVYPLDRLPHFLDWKTRWEAALREFPSTTTDIWCAGDLFVLGHYTASVYHLMRVLELGLKALAGSLGLPVDRKMWGEVIRLIEGEIRQASQGSISSDRRRFLSQAATSFTFFKDAWRNHVAHSNEHYDERQCLHILLAVQKFMNELADGLKIP